MSRSGGPPGWPADVPPPDAPGWERRATGWLFDLCPADLRAHEVLQRQPLVLAYVAIGQLDGALAGLRSTLAGVRADLKDWVDPEALTQAVAALQLEQARLEGARRSTLLVADALRGVRHRPRL
jgi:hypothetical protein